MIKDAIIQRPENEVTCAVERYQGHLRSKPSGYQSARPRDARGLKPLRRDHLYDCRLRHNAFDSAFQAVPELARNAMFLLLLRK